MGSRERRGPVTRVSVPVWSRDAGRGRALSRSRAAWPLEVFAVDDCSVQLMWRGSPRAGLRVEIGETVAQPVASAQAELLVSVFRWRGAPSLAGDDPFETPSTRSGHGGYERGRGKGAPGADDRAGRDLGSRLRLRGSRVLDPAWPAGPGTVVINGLQPGTTYEVVASAEDVPAFLAGRVTTVRPPEGRLLSTLAAVTDLHVGERHFGVWGRIWDRGGLGFGQGRSPYPVRALEAALEEVAAWGAELVVAKGDLTRIATSAELSEAGRLLANSPVPVEAVLGNHDNALNVDMRAVLQANGVRVSWGPRAVDVPGLRIVLVNSAHADPHNHFGHLPATAGRQVAELAGEAPTPAMVVLHHPPDLHRYPTVYPPGIPWDQSKALLEALVAKKPDALLSCGHRHRNRRYAYGPVVIAETGSTKDYPGAWAGYKVYETGVLQVVRRTGRPDVIGWTEVSRRAMNGQWGRWSPGRLGDRCFSVSWR